MQIVGQPGMDNLRQQGFVFARFVLFAEAEQAETTVTTEGVQACGRIFVIGQARMAGKDGNKLRCGSEKLTKFLPAGGARMLINQRKQRERHR